MTFSKGSLILIDYTGKFKDSDDLFDTTIEADAKKYSIYEDHIKYQPKLVSINAISYPVLVGLDEALAKTSVGEKLTVEVLPEKGFGLRDTAKIRMIPLRKLGEDADKVTVGDTIEIDNKKGIIRFIGSGRVQIDYNHKYAGKTIIFDVTVIKLIESSHDKIEAILQYQLPAHNSDISFTLKDNIVDILIPKNLYSEENLSTLKRFIYSDIFEFAPELAKINFIETYENLTTPPPAKTTPQKVTKTE